MRITTSTRFLLFAMFALIANVSLGQTKAKSPQKFTIKGHIEGLKDTTIYLANYYGKSLYYNDTCKVDSKGNYSFKGKPYNECGKYALVMPGPKYFDFIVAEENIVINATADNDISKIEVKESENNKVFFDYIRYISTKIKDRNPIDVVLNDSTKTEEDKKPYRDQLKALNNEVMDYQRQLVAKNPELLASKLIKMNLEIEAPAPPDSITNEDRKKLWQYYWYRSHYWDNVDLTDPRMVREQTFHRLLETYITQTLPQIPDTLCVEATKLINRIPSSNEDVFKYVVHLITYTSEVSKVMCMDRVFVYMVDTYAKPGKMTWMKKDKLDAMFKAADEKRACRCGETAPDIILPDQSGKKWVDMKKTGGKYTMLVIWESTCGHCKKEVPKLLDLYHKYKDKGLVVYAIGNELENDKWIEFIKEKGLDWINVSDTPEIMKQDSASKLVWQGITTLQSLNYRTTWDVNSTPKVFLMDKDYKIIAKQLGSEQFDELLQRLEEGKEIKLEGVKEHEYEDEDAGHKGGTTNMKPRQAPPAQQKK
jgi:thiol-disulfide isomerase/thioredoxin